MTSVTKNTSTSFQVADLSHGVRNLKYYPAVRRVDFCGVWLTVGQVRKLSEWMVKRVKDMEETTDG